MSDITTLMMAAAGQGGEETDPNFNQTVLLLHGDGTNGAQNNTFLDSSTNNFTITRNGNTTQGTFSPFSRSSGNLVNAPYDPAVHGGSGYFDGSGDYLSVASTTEFGFGTGDFTIECWLYPTSVTGNRLIFDTRTTNPEVALMLYLGGADLKLLVNGADQIVGTSAIIINQWQHIALVRNSGTTKLYVNGTQVGSSYTDTNNYPSSPPLKIATYFVADQVFYAGYISNFRIVKSTAVYTSAFTPPTSPVTAVSGTSLLCNFTNAGIFDNTGKNNLETVADAQIDTGTKKFGTGSMEFDGTGDWLKVPNSPDIQLGTGNFTIEFWVYLATGDTGSARGLVAKGGASTGWLVSLDSSEKVVFTYTTSTITSSGAITTNAWNHIAVVREGTGSNQTKIYIGGTNDGTGTVSTDFNQTEVMYIGANRAAGDPMKGFIDDLRITKGVARYTTTFTPPTAAFPNL